jgi:hypothetical protein
VRFPELLARVETLTLIVCLFLSWSLIEIQVVNGLTPSIDPLLSLTRFVFSCFPVNKVIWLGTQWRSRSLADWPAGAYTSFEIN